MIATDSKDYILTANDRCDASCSAQAYIMVSGVTGKLYFCVHHYEKILSTEAGREKMNSFAYEVLDERERLIENRLVGEN